MKIKDIIILVLSILLLLSIGFNIYQYRCQDPPETVTVEVRDTIQIEKERIVEHTRPVYVTKYDTIVQHIERRDSIVDTISVPVEIPITHYEYRDTIKNDSSTCNLLIKYSGYRTSIDTIGINYHLTREIPVNQRKRVFGQAVGIGVSAGYGLHYSNAAFIPGPYIGISVNYTIGYVWMK